MPSHKLEIRKQYGTFYAKFGSAAAAAAPEKSFRDLEEVIDYVRKEASKLDMEAEDPVIFRGIAYTSMGELMGQVRSGAY